MWGSRFRALFGRRALGRSTQPSVILLAILLAAGLWSARTAGGAGEVNESYDDGQIKLRYRTDANDRKNGTYDEYFPNGKPKVHGTYTADKKTGTWNIYNEAGKVVESTTYRNGLLNGPYAWNFPSGKPALQAQYRQGELSGPLTVLDEKGRTVRRVSYPRTRESVEKAYNTLYKEDRPPVKFTREPHVEPPYRAGALSEETLTYALNLTKLYRYLSGVPWQELKTDPMLCEKSAHGAVVLKKIGSLTHTPSKPSDMDDGFFKIAYAGCHEANLAMTSDPVAAVRSFMDDSDSTNVDRIGHRQWVLSPGLQRVGFGSADDFTAMHVVNGADHPAPEYTFAAFPGEGFYPRKLFEEHYVWSVHLNGNKAKLGPADALKVKLQKLDEHFQPDGDPIAAKIVSVPTFLTASLGWCVIVFKPELPEIEPAKYWVEISGIKTLTGADAPFGYLVEFIDIAAPQAADGSSKDKKNN
ncbi:MAG: S-layer protein [Phycisphaerales bacterium]|nr:S-layer protein [Phycisphaerales bacterium]